MSRKHQAHVSFKSSSEQRKAYAAVSSAVAKGNLVRPSVCPRCNRNPGSGSDGRSRIQAHHADYSKPLDVEWLCQSCHRIEEREERKGAVKLTKEAVLEIRKRLFGNKKLADMYHVSTGTITSILLMRTWKDV